MMDSRNSTLHKRSTSVVIVNFNGRHHLDECLLALRAQTLPPDEIVVVDNNSTDGSVEHIKLCYPEVTLVELDQNRGFTGGNIEGYQISTGDYLVLLNNDTSPRQDWLERLQSCAGRNPAVGIVASHVTDWDGNYTDTAGDGCSVTGRGFKLRHKRRVSEPLESGYVFSASACAALYKRTMLEQVGFLDPHFFMNAEDTDLAFRAQLQGWKTFFCSEAVVRHRIGASQGVHSKLHVYYAARNHAWLYLKCMPGRLILKYLPARIFHTILYLVYFARMGRLLAYLGGLFAATKALPLVMRERQIVQKSRSLPVRELEARLSPLRTVLAQKRRTLH
jgi:GT2 family glycosyltransferase